MKNSTLVLVALLVSSTVHAQEREPSQMLTVSASIFCVAGNLADLIATGDLLANGHSHESNSLINGSSIGRITANKAITVGLTVVALKLLADHGHPKIAAVLGFGSGFVGFGAAYHNAGQR